jgi:hypothetical protein
LLEALSPLALTELLSKLVPCTYPLAEGGAESVAGKGKDAIGVDEEVEVKVVVVVVMGSIAARW